MDSVHTDGMEREPSPDGFGAMPSGLQGNVQGAAREPWKVVRSATCGHLRAEHNYNSDPRKEWTDEDIALIESAPDMRGAIDVALRIVNGPNMPGGCAKNQLVAVLGAVQVQSSARRALTLARGGEA